MPSELEKTGIDQAAVSIEEPLPAEPLISESDLAKHFVKQSVSISLKYYLRSCECFSEWQKGDLKKFSSAIDKIRGYDADQLQRTQSLCGIHKGEPKYARFRRPETISDDIVFHEIKIDPSNKARAHGFFVEGVFFLVWLDRNHECFEE
ncbi:hypothetical protein NB311A_01435 [Nitrobacter sp. Nb-311A]|uniref:hypothetical protein n=1 Tax=Nitrobacter sp. Nb-311A TaxID=314253 RepID=UPI00006866ED|nr:hypothetical protein [Nitrobacter sp. Nb-311A]EAQ35993.1 hypothetical protein NB311A_01435 [Nitrobacter sp. Nb-311A]